MNLFGKKRDEELEEEYEDEYASVRSRRKIRDLNPQNKRKRKEPPKPWGKKERYIVLSILLVTVLASGVLAISARDFKLPGLPRLSTDFKVFKLNLFKEETITIGKGTREEKKRADKIIADFDSKTKDLSGTYALYAIDLKSGYSFGIDEEKVMQAASLIKLPIMLYVQGKVDESKIEAMGKRSDNSVFIEMRKKFGDEILQNYIGELGMVNTSIEKNETTPKEIGDFFRKYQDEAFMKYLVDTIFEDWLTKGVPEGVKVVHKYGREVHVVNDAGIVYAKNAYIVVIMTQGVVEKEADEVFPELSRLVYDGFNQ